MSIVRFHLACHKVSKLPFRKLSVLLSFCRAALMGALSRSAFWTTEVWGAAAHQHLDKLIPHLSWQMIALQFW